MLMVEVDTTDKAPGAVGKDRVLAVVGAAVVAVVLVAGAVGSYPYLVGLGLAPPSHALLSLPLLMRHL